MTFMEVIIMKMTRGIANGGREMSPLLLAWSS